jgi:glycosyltransferase involved in cell wall biosynthesis
MKLLFLCKRRPQSKDLLRRPYGRFYHLPRLLSERGHTVYNFLLSYESDPPVTIHRNGSIWQSVSFKKYRPFDYAAVARRIVSAFEPEWIVGFSDIYYGIIAQWLARKQGVRSAIDAYDNYESYIPWLFPLHLAWRMALKRADLVTAAGPQLARLLNRSRPRKSVRVVPMAADSDEFRSLDKRQCRQRMNLPQDKTLIGYFGSIYNNRSIQTVFGACAHVRCQIPDSILVLSGRRQRGLQLPENTLYLGYLTDEMVPVLLNCMDVVLVPNECSKFGNYSYPVKLYEAMVCRIPVVAAATAPARWILGHREAHLTRPGDAREMADGIVRVMRKQPDYGELSTWENSCDAFERALQACS